MHVPSRSRGRVRITTVLRRVLWHGVICRHPPDCCVQGFDVRGCRHRVMACFTQKYQCAPVLHSVISQRLGCPPLCATILTLPQSHCSQRCLVLPPPHRRICAETACSSTRACVSVTPQGQLPKEQHLPATQCVCHPETPVPVCPQSCILPCAKLWRARSSHPRRE